MKIPRILRMLWTLSWIASAAHAASQRRGAKEIAKQTGKYWWNCESGSEVKRVLSMSWVGFTEIHETIS